MGKGRQIRYNFMRSSFNLDCNELFFLIVDEKREIERIENKIYSLFAPIIEEGKSLCGKVSGIGLRYKLINFESKKGIESNEVSKIYPHIFRDRNLYIRKKKKDALENYVEDSLNN